MKEDNLKDELYPESVKSWEKIVHEAKKAGFRDGANSARESNYQQYFDKGYSAGFKNAHQLGTVKGLLQARALLNAVDNPISDALNETKKGACIVCSHKPEATSIDEIVKKQEDHVNELMVNMKY